MNTAGSVFYVLFLFLVGLGFVALGHTFKWWGPKRAGGAVALLFMISGVMAASIILPGLASGWFDTSPAETETNL